MALDDENVRDLLMSDNTDPREVALFLCQPGSGIDATEQEQRRRIIEALNAHHSRRLADETVALAQSTRSLATWTRWLAIATFVVALGTLGLAIATILDNNDHDDHTAPITTSTSVAR